MRSYGQYCSVAKALDVIGDRWSLLILRELMLQGPCRYTDLLTGLPGVATNLLADRLRELEHAGVITREAAPPPVATTLFHLTTAGEELEPVIRALGRWGARFMPQPTGDEQFRSHWLAFPISEFVRDSDPGGAQVTIEIHAGDRPATVEAHHGELRTRLGAAESPDLILDGPPPLILGVLTGQLKLPEARELGLRLEGNEAVLRRLRPVGLPAPEAAA